MPTIDTQYATNRRALLEALDESAASTMMDCDEPSKYLSTVAFVANDLVPYATISIDNPNRISYNATGLLEKQTEWKTRQTVKAHRWLRRQIDSAGKAERFSETEIDQWGDLLVGSFGGSNVVDRFKILHGNDLVNWYYECNIPGNCMSGKSSIVRCYAENPHVQCLSWRDNGSKARALIWDCTTGLSNPVDVKILDRIYPNTGAHVEQFKRWAKSNGYLTRNHNGLPEGDVRYSGTCAGRNYSNVCVETTLDVSCGALPYLDTFHYVVGHSDDLLTLTSESGEEIFRADSTCGDIRDSRSCCEDCRIRVHDSELRHGWCEYCFGDHMFLCDGCGSAEHNDDRYSANDQTFCQSCFDDRYTECESCDELTLRADLQTISAERIVRNVGHSDKRTIEVCSVCFDNSECHDCGEYHITIIDSNLCPHCEQQAREVDPTPAPTTTTATTTTPAT